jgi:hypothetical protein
LKEKSQTKPKEVKNKKKKKKVKRVRSESNQKLAKLLIIYTKLSALEIRREKEKKLCLK